MVSLQSKAGAFSKFFQPTRQVNWRFDNTSFSSRLSRLHQTTSSKSLFKETEPQTFYALSPVDTVFQISNNVHVKSFQYLALLAFVSKLFQKLKYVKSKYKTNLSDEHLRETLGVGNGQVRSKISRKFKTRAIPNFSSCNVSQ